MDDLEKHNSLFQVRREVHAKLPAPKLEQLRHNTLMASLFVSFVILKSQVPNATDLKEESQILGHMRLGVN